MTHNYLVFLLAGRLFGVKLLGALEILPWRRSRPVPLSYSSVEGLIDYRGVIYPVINLGRRLSANGPGLDGVLAREAPRTEGARSIILLDENRAPFGIVVDSVVKMQKFEEPSEAPEQVPGVDMKYIQGIVLEGDQKILMLNCERLLHAG